MFHVPESVESDSVTVHSHYLRPSTDFIDSAWGALEIHCGSVRQVASVACIKRWETFRAATDHKSGSKNICQYVICRAVYNHIGTTPMAAGDVRIEEKVIISYHYGIHFAFSRLLSGQQFDWRQAASTKTSPPYVRHAVRNPSTDGGSVNEP